MIPGKSLGTHSLVPQEQKVRVYPKKFIENGDRFARSTASDQAAGFR